MKRIANPGLMALAIAALSAGPAFATEGGGSIYPQGVEGFMAGALPPPGLYGMVYGESYRADRVMDAQGHDEGVPGFHVSANAVVPRLIWVPGVKLFGGDMVVHTIVPLVDLEVKAAGAQQRKTGVGDITVGLGTGYHLSPSLHSVIALDVFLPTGGYSKSDLANIGRHYAAFEPVLAVTQVDPAGLNADIKAGYLVNGRNAATGVKSGQEFHFDYDLAWGLGNGLVLGAGGYVYQQASDDKQDGASLAGSKGRAFAIGPAAKYDSGKGWFVSAKWQQEFGVENRARGNAVWLKAVFPL